MTDFALRRVRRLARESILHTRASDKTQCVREALEWMVASSVRDPLQMWAKVIREVARELAEGRRAA